MYSGECVHLNIIFMDLIINILYLHNKLLVDKFLCYTGLELRWFQKPQEKFVDNLKREDK